MNKEKTGWDNYYEEKDSVDKKLLFSYDEMQVEKKFYKKAYLIFAMIISFLLGITVMCALAKFFPEILKN